MPTSSSNLPTGPATRCPTRSESGTVRRRPYHFARSALALVALAGGLCAPVPAQPLPGTAPLTESGDFAAAMVAGLDRFLDRELAALPARRTEERARAFTGPEAERARLRHILGVVDERAPVQMRFLAPAGPQGVPAGAELARGPGYRVFAVVWTVFRGVEGEGLLLEPEAPLRAQVVAVPDCDWTPEQLAGLQPGLPPDRQFARRLAELGCRVLVPVLIERSDRFAGNPGVHTVRHSQRETLWRAAYEMGRTPAGYEIQKVLAAADWLEAQSSLANRALPLGVIGHGEGGLVAFYAAALDPRFQAAAICGYFAPHDRLHEEPIYRNVWSLRRDFGEADVARLIRPRRLVLEYGYYPEVQHPDQHGGAPGRLERPAWEAVQAEAARAADAEWAPALVRAGPQEVDAVETLAGLCRGLGLPEPPATGAGATEPRLAGPLPDAAARQLRQYRQLLEDTQHLMREAEYTRREFWQRADFRSLAAFSNSTAWYRDHFAREIVGLIPPASLPPNPRSRLLYETNGIRGYEVLLDLHPEVFAHGILVLPAGLKDGERRPVVVCQHGLEGRPTDVADPRVENPAYHRYAFRLAERGFVTFAPQNPYIGGTRFRQVLRKAQPLGLTLWSFIVRQHEVITDWLAKQPFADPERLAFYGLSYGGKTAMRVPVLVDRYCLSICSADFNEWIWKNVSARAPYSYLWTGEYDMPEFNLGNTFNYAELSWLICPRPFMVERGHDDGVAPDEWVAYEYAKTRRHYVKLGLGDRTEIEFFDGPHTIHGVGTFEFLHRHLNWSKP